MQTTSLVLVAAVALAFPIGIWALAECKGKDWQRCLAGLFMAACFAACGAGIAAINAYTERLLTSYYVNHASQEMLTAAIRRLEDGDREELIDDFRWMRHEIGHPKTDRPMIEEPFLAFAEGKAGDAP